MGKEDLKVKESDGKRRADPHASPAQDVSQSERSDECRHPVPDRRVRGYPRSGCRVPPVVSDRLHRRIVRDYI